MNVMTIVTVARLANWRWFINWGPQRGQRAWSHSWLRCDPCEMVMKWETYCWWTSSRHFWEWLLEFLQLYSWIFPDLLPIPQSWNLLNSWCSPWWTKISIDIHSSWFFSKALDVLVSCPTVSMAKWLLRGHTEVAAVVQEYDRLLASWRRCFQRILTWTIWNFEHVGMLRDVVESITI